MRWINKSNPPNSLQLYKKQVGAIYKDIDSNVKDDLEKTLLEEQDNLCAYYQQKINQNNMQVEHHCEQSICNGTNGQPDRRLDYTNLLAVCQGKSGTDLHCDSKKATDEVRKYLPMEILPTIKEHIATIIYSGSGKLSSSNSEFQEEIENVLNLNLDYLKSLRKERWNGIFKFSMNAKKKINTKKMQRLLEKEIDKKSAFTGMFEYMLDRYSK